MKNRIRKIRKNAELTQKEFAQKLGIAQNTVAGYETGIRIPRGSVIKMICQKFNVNEDWLCSGIGEPYIDLPEDPLIARAALLLGKKDPFFEAALETYRKLTPKNRELWIKNGLDLLDNENRELLKKTGLDSQSNLSKNKE